MVTPNILTQIPGKVQTLSRFKSRFHGRMLIAAFATRLRYTNHRNTRNTRKVKTIIYKDEEYAIQGAVFLGCWSTLVTVPRQRLKELFCEPRFMKIKFFVYFVCFFEKVFQKTRHRVLNKL